eukprot:1183982-Prorocentrum_minimum.AAC.4
MGLSPGWCVHPRPVVGTGLTDPRNANEAALRVHRFGHFASVRWRPSGWRRPGPPVWWTWNDCLMASTESAGSSARADLRGPYGSIVGGAGSTDASPEPRRWPPTKLSQSRNRAGAGFLSSTSSSGLGLVEQSPSSSGLTLPQGPSLIPRGPPSGNNNQPRGASNNNQPRSSWEGLLSSSDQSSNRSADQSLRSSPAGSSQPGGYRSPGEIKIPRSGLVPRGILRSFGGSGADDNAARSSAGSASSDGGSL